MWHDGVHRDPSTWDNGVLTITKIASGDYTVVEANHSLDTMFPNGTGIPAGKQYTHSWTYKVGDAAATDGSDPDSGTRAAVVDGSETIVLVTNTYEELKQGALKLTKLVTVKGVAPNTDTYHYVDGDYTFTIVGPEGAASPVTKYVRITVTDGVAASYKIADSNTDAAWEAAATVTEGTALIDGLDAGDYTVTEMPVEGLEVSGITGGVAGTANTTARTVTVRVTAGDTAAAQADASATYTNNKPLGDLDITKNIQTNSTLDTTKTGTFYYAVYSEAYDAAAGPAQEPVRTGSIVVPAGGTATVTEPDLPYGTYYVYELTGEGGTPIVSGDNGVNTAIGGKVYKVTGSGTAAMVGATKVTATLTNDEEIVDMDVLKVWKNEDDTAPENVTITVGLYKGADSEEPVSTIVLNGTADGTVTDGTFTQAEDDTTGSANAYEDEPWHAKWSNLPKYDTEAPDTEITYVVKEVDVPEGYSVSYVNGQYAIKGESITNTKNPGDLELTKVVEGEGADLTKEFEFTVSLTFPAAMAAETTFQTHIATTTDPAEPEGTPTNTTEDGTPVTVAASESTKEITVTLKHNQTWIIDDLPAGTTYTITETPDGAYLSDAPKSGTVAGGTVAKESVTITNTYDLKDYSFHKKWTDGVSDTARTWPKDANDKKLPITVTLMGELKDGETSLGYLNDETTKDSYMFVLDPEAEVGTANALPRTVTISIGGVDRSVTISLAETDNDYTVTFSGLSKTGAGTGENADKTGEWNYYVIEDTVPGYQPPQYTKADGTVKTDDHNARDGEFVVNRRIVYELPSTGGTGTTMFYIGGASLMFLAVVAFVWQQKKRYQLIGD